MPEESTILYVEEVARITGKSAGNLRWRRHMDLPPASFKLGRRVVYEKHDVLNWIADCKRETVRGAA